YQVSLDQLQSRLNAQEDFAHFVTDHNPESMMIFDKDNLYWFVNQRAAQELGQDVRDLIKKSPDKVIGYDRARQLEKRLNEVRNSMHALETLDQIRGKDGQTRFVQSHYEYVAPFRDFSGGVLLREEDVTNLIIERERRASMLRQVIGTLVAV